MPKSKSKNRKRAKKLRQRKKQREEFQNNEIDVYASMKKRVQQQYKGIDIQIRNKNSAKVKISDLVLQLIAPLMEKAKNFNEESDIAGLGVMAWNLGTLKSFKGEDEMLKSLDEFGIMIPNDYKKLLLEFAGLKCKKFPDFDQLIYDYEFKSINSQNNNLSVAYKSIKED